MKCIPSFFVFFYAALSPGLRRVRRGGKGAELSVETESALLCLVQNTKRGVASGRGTNLGE